MSQRRTLTAIAVLLAVALVLSLAAVWRPAPAPPAETPDVPTAIANAERYLTAQKALRMDVALFCQFLRRKFGVPQFPFRFDRNYPQRVGFMRVVDPAALVTSAEVEALRSPLGVLMVRALHCDYLPLPDDYVKALEESTRAGGYDLTHAVLATKWAIENGGLQRAALADLIDLQTAMLIDLIEDESATNDLRMEAMTFLCYSGQSRHIRAEWVQRVLATQNPDGGWYGSGPAKGASHQHITQLGLWFLLEYQTPGLDEPVVAPDPER